MNNNKPLAVIAFGGNALVQSGQTGTAEQQLDNLIKPMRQVAELSRNYRLVITHGNGPQVGNLLLQQESCQNVPKMPLEIIVAMTQGQIGYMIESSLDTALMEMGISDRLFLTLITYVVVDGNDPGFTNPTKPIGPFYTKEQAAGLPYTMKETDKGVRRVVASPRPLHIVEEKEIKKLVGDDVIVICTGGGGIPVVQSERRFQGVEAVIDKDLATSVLAREIKADVFVIATDAPGAAVNWGKPDERILGKVSVAEMKQYISEGHFPPGSMGPKVEAVLEYVETTGNRGVICHLDDIDKAVIGGVGTEIVSN
jgi:carbamate kinase